MKHRPLHPSSPSSLVKLGAKVALALGDALWQRRTAARLEGIVCAPDAPALPVGRPFSVLVWNVQFCAGRHALFFYDGGEAVHVPAEHTLQTLSAIAKALQDLSADIVLLQEVDRDSDRTGRIDQHLELLRRVPYPCHTSTPYFRNRYVPHPSHQHLGRVDMHLSIFSRFALRRAQRHPLPALRESWLRRQFNLRRAILSVELPVEDGRVLQLLDTHLSAFSHGDGTLPEQVRAVAERMAEAERQGRQAIVGGDFNALPPGDDPARLGPDAALYRDEGWPLAELFERWQSAVPLEAHQDEPERWRTWLPHGSDTPDRALDHLFTTRGLEILDTTVASGLHDLSDHLPLRVELMVNE